MDTMQSIREISSVCVFVAYCWFFCQTGRFYGDTTCILEWPVVWKIW